MVSYFSSVLSKLGQNVTYLFSRKMQILEQPITGEIIAAAIEVHKNLGPGLLESTYQHCMAVELEFRGLKYLRECGVPIIYKGRRLENGFRVDFLVENEVVVELKALQEVAPIHESQLLTYLKLLNKSIGLLINFNVTCLKYGIRRMIN